MNKEYKTTTKRDDPLTPIIVAFFVLTLSIIYVFLKRAFNKLTSLNNRGQMHTRRGYFTPIFILMFLLSAFTGYQEPILTGIPLIDAVLFGVFGLIGGLILVIAVGLFVDGLFRFVIFLIEKLLLEPMDDRGQAAVTPHPILIILVLLFGIMASVGYHDPVLTGIPLADAVIFGVSSVISTVLTFLFIRAVFTMCLRGGSYLIEKWFRAEKEVS